MKNRFPILIADDDPIGRKLLENTLVKSGHKVVAAEDGLKALNLFSDEFFPIVLTDWMMPGMNGLDLCRALRKKQLPGYVFIILLTARDSKDDIIAGLEAGADDYLSKPFLHAELIARINTGIRILELEKSLHRANEKIKRMSVTDSLTGCYNKWYLNKHLPVEISRSKRYNRALSVIMCDIDHFKKVNDTFGHLAGDEVLKNFSSCLMQSVRKKIDWVVRYGGEEFLFVLPETEKAGAYELAERIRRKVARQKTIINDVSICITASFGISCYLPLTGDMIITTDEIIKHADKLLYKSKQDGRNRTTMEPDQH
ncbi:MAG: diguanylate cyclase response regulator [Desulfobacteraceae bacterium 4572_123]|nr:MAG: diguanylate cyclase response regulator [Desulfobacteraceae bacterium 4572_123]